MTCNVLIVGFDYRRLNNHDNVNLVFEFSNDIRYILTDDLPLIPQIYHDLVLRNIELLEFNLQRAIKLFELGQYTKQHSIISSNCTAGFMKQYLNNPLIGPCAFWRYDMLEFYNDLLNDQDSFFKSLTSEKDYYENNGHYYCKDQFRRIAFNHYKSTDILEIKSMFNKRMNNFNIDKVIIVMVMDRSNYSRENITELLNKYSNIIIITNYKMDHPNLFSYPNYDNQYYLKGMKFLTHCNDEDVDKFIDIVKAFGKINIYNPNYSQLDIDTFNIIIRLANDLMKKKFQLKLVNSKLKAITSTNN